VFGIDECVVAVSVVRNAPEDKRGIQRNRIKAADRDTDRLAIGVKRGNDGHSRRKATQRPTKIRLVYLWFFILVQAGFLVT
jgi:hypothetical protein